MPSAGGTSPPANTRTGLESGLDDRLSALALGDGSLVEMTRERDARRPRGRHTAGRAKRSKLPPLGEDELDHLQDIFCSNARFTAVDIGDEVILSYDGSGNADVGSRIDEMLVYQNHHGADMTELWNIDYSYKADQDDPVVRGQRS